MLKYIGRGSFIPGVPARDLTDEEVKEYGEQRLIKSNLYEKPRGDNSKKSKAVASRVDRDTGREDS